MISSSSCSLDLQAHEILAALDGDDDCGLGSVDAITHVAECDACRDVVRLRATARGVWTTPMSSSKTRAADDDADALRRVWEGSSRPRRRRRAPLIAFAAAAPLCIVAVVIALFVRAPASSSSSTNANSIATNELALTAPSPGIDSSATKSATAPPPLASTKPSTPAAQRNMVVPAGSHVMLSFSLPSESAELIGPASATTTDSAITLDRGTVKVSALRHVNVLVPGARLDPNGSTCTIHVDDRGVARVNVESGRALVAGKAAGSPTITIEAGGSMELDPDGSVRVGPTTKSASDEENVRPGSGSEAARANEKSARPGSGSEAARANEKSAALSSTIAPPPAPPSVLNDALKSPIPPTKNSDDAIASARSRMRDGSATARSELETLAQSSDARVARRASFTLAEMDLANAGDRSKANARLEALVTCPEPGLGADAATLLARSLGSPTDRAAVWKRYLATNPPRPYFERALLDRAEALIDGGNVGEARTILAEVKQSPQLTDSQRRQLERLQYKAR